MAGDHGNIRQANAHKKGRERIAPFSYVLADPRILPATAAFPRR